jgi:16S rRNA (cytosine967-C5)-methyltransferase
MSVDPVRLAALAVLDRVEEGLPLAPALEDAHARVDAAGSALLYELVLGTLRWRGRYDRIIRRLSRRRPPRDPRLVNLLRLSLHQLVGCHGIPAYAAVHQAGELCRCRSGARAVGYVNGLLQAVARRLAGHPDDPWRALGDLFPAPDREPAAHLSDWLSHPLWAVERWVARWGLDAATALCRHGDEPAPLSFHVLAPHEPERCAETLRAEGIAVAPGRWCPRALVAEGTLPRARVRALLEAHPELIVQDEGAQAATAWHAEGLAGGILDLCAAPGGKTFHLRARLGPRGHVIAADVSRPRLRLVLDTAKRIEAGPLPVVLADGAAPPFRPGSCGAVLLDGPCSGTGVWRHHPEGRWALAPGDLRARREKLLALATAAADLLAPGGRLLYVTCSLEREENEDVVTALRAARGDLEPDPAPPAPGTRPADGETGSYWLPAETGTDGFYAARLRRRGGSR